MPSEKLSNPKDAIGSTKLPLHLVSPAFKAFTSIGLLNGMLKYGRSNWREAGVRFSIYYDALNRHMDDLLDGEWEDPDDMVPHLCAAAACLNIIVDAWVTGQLVDDRNYMPHDTVIGMRRAIDQLTPYVEKLKAHHADRDPKHWTHADNTNTLNNGRIQTYPTQKEDRHESPAGGLPDYRAVRGLGTMVQMGLGHVLTDLDKKDPELAAKVRDVYFRD